MEKLNHKDLLAAGVHFGHLRKKWNPRMLPNIFMEEKGIHIIDLNRTLESLEESAAALRSIARSGKKILFVATKKQAKEIVTQAANRVNMPYVTERWLGGMLTNFQTIRKSIKKMQSIEKMMTDGTFESITKKERLMLEREKAKLEKVLGGIAQLGRLPAALFIVDIMNEHIALAEAKRLNIPTIAMVDTNSDPTSVDFAIPANDDATKSIAIITNYLTDAVVEGLADRQKDKEENAEGGEEEESGDRKPAFADVEAVSEEGGEKKRAPRGGGRGGNRGGGGSRGSNRTGGGNRTPRA
ncbi:MAG TPA: 30S ribosomal protein S2 [Bacteroidetes bacterium]|nr:30S ribosomal protein S2 [Bacteroidota bacterium]